jgi:four helix bundle protein
MRVKHYRELTTWQKAMDLVDLVYEATESFPKREMFGLTNQLRRAVVSVPSNIAEGQGRSSTREFLQFLSIARGSLQETETQLIIADRRGYLTHGSLHELLETAADVMRLLNGLIRSLEP